MFKAYDRSRHHGEKRQCQKEFDVSLLEDELQRVLNHTDTLCKESEEKYGIGNPVRNTERGSLLGKLELQAYQANCQTHDGDSKRQRSHVVEHQHNVMVFLRNQPIYQRCHTNIFTALDDERNGKVDAPYQTEQGQLFHGRCIHVHFKPSPEDIAGKYLVRNEQA